MTSSISKSPSGAVFAFTDAAPVRPCSMVSGVPVVSTMLEVGQLQEWATTLEEILPNVPLCHVGAITLMIVKFESLLHVHRQQHQEIISEAPTPEDMVEYLSAYLRAMAAQEV
jgi:hypothetical protein